MEPVNPSTPPRLTPPAGGLEEWAPALNSPDDVRAAVELAFDYRGDVTLATRDGRTHAGYVFNRATEGVAEPYREYLPRDGGAAVRVPLKDVVGVTFSGPDAAAGRSWDAWVRRVEEKKQALAEGRDLGNIEPQPLPLE